MPNLRLVIQNYHDEAALSGQLAEASGFPLTNTQTIARDAVWRSGDLTAQYIQGVFPSDGHLVDSFGLFRHGCLGGTVQLFGYQMPDLSDTPVLDTGKLETVDLIALGSFEPFGTTPLGVVGDPFVSEAPLMVYFTAAALKAYRIRFEDTHVQAANPWWQVGRVVLGKSFEFTVNPSYGSEIGFATNVEKQRTRGGSQRAGAGAFWRSFTLPFSWIAEADRPTFVDAMRHLMTARDVVCSIFPEAGGRLERDNTINGTLASLEGLGRQVSWLTGKLVIEEN